MTRLFNVLIFTLCALLSSSGLIVLKMAMTAKPLNFSNIVGIFFSLRFMSGFILYVSGFLIWMYILSKYKLGIAYPVMTTLLLIMVTVGSYLILNESLSVRQLIGIAICLCGIILLST